MNFTTVLFQEIISNLYNEYTDNHDQYRFGPDKIPHSGFLNKNIKTILARNRIYRVGDNHQNLLNTLDRIGSNVEGFDYLFRHLEDEFSKQLLTQLVSYRVLGKTKYKLPLNTPEYWQQLKEIDRLADLDDYILDYRKNPLNRYHLDNIGFPIQLYFCALGIMADFVLRQYEYHQGKVQIKAKPGDYVIDAGGCYGDTALYFANEVKEKGKVFTFEFIPSNLKIMKTNFQLNPALAESIQVATSPLWSTHGNQLFYKDQGPASQAQAKVFENFTDVTQTTTIDSFVEVNKVPKIDFIKMDIEGAEFPALQGAIHTIKKYKPDLAISVYHSLSDFYRVPSFIKNLNAGYKLYLNHYTIHNEETILFASAKKAI